jgi:hypothetical protein
MRNPLAAHPPWRQLLIITLALPLAIVLAVLAFTWPSARLRPRDLPVGMVGSTAATRTIAGHLDAAPPGGFALRRYASARSAETAIRDRDAYGAFVVSGDQLEVLEASAAGPAVAQVLTTAGQELAAGTSARTELTVVDVVPLSAQDPKGLVLSSALLPLTICSIIVAAAIGLVVRVRPAWRQLLAVSLVSTVAAAGAYLIGQSWLGALPGNGAGDWATLAITIAAMASATAELIALIGLAGLGLAAAAFVFVGNPFSGASSAPQLLPGIVNHLGQWLPPGAGLSLLRSVAYFHGHGVEPHLAVLLTWTAVGVLAIVVGHHGPIRFAAQAGTDHPPASSTHGHTTGSSVRLGDRLTAGATTR